jgi:hypothetical protein
MMDFSERLDARQQRVARAKVAVEAAGAESREQVAQRIEQAEDVLLDEGVSDFSRYNYLEGGELEVDLYVDSIDPPVVRTRSWVNPASVSGGRSAP